MTSRLLGLVREQVIAYYFGAGNAVDAYRVAFRVPNLLRDLFAEGAMSAAFVPTFTKVLTADGKAAAWRLASSVINALVIVTSLLVLAGFLFAEPLVRLYAGSFAEVPGKIELTVQLTRIMLPFLTLVAVAAATMGMLNSLGHFFVPALSPAMFNVATIVMAILFVPFAEDLGVEPILVIAVSTLVGGLGQIALQWPPLRSEGYRYRPVVDARNPAVRRVLVLMGPGMIGLAATQINVLVNTMLATSEGPGAVSWLDFAFRLMYLPIGLFGVSIAAASLPPISRLAAAADRPGMRSAVGSAIALMLVLNVPATLGLIVLARPIVELIYEHGRFGPSDTESTAAALQFYAFGLIGYSVVRIVTPTFYALHRSRVPVAAGAVSVLTNVAINLALVRVLGYRGLALGTSITALLNATLQMWLLRKELDGVDGTRVSATFGKMLMASVPMAGAAWATERMLAGVIVGDHVVARLARVGAAIGVALAVLGIAAHFLKVREFADVRALVLRRLRR